MSERTAIEAMRDALGKLVAYLDHEVARARKCNKCKYNGKSFRGEPCYWHVDCGLDEHDIKAADDAKYLLCKFKLQEALDSTPRNCDRFPSEADATAAFYHYCVVCKGGDHKAVCKCKCREACAWRWLFA